jgi:phosphoglycolate phosphatase
MVTIRCAGVTFERIQAVLFDKDGTLADSAPFLRGLAQKRSRLIDAQVPGVQEPLLMAFGVESDRLNPAGLMAIGTRRENEIAAAAYVAETGRDWLPALQLVEAAFREADQYGRKADATPLRAGAIELLEAMAGAGLRLGILSSDSTANVQDFVTKNQLASYFSLQMGTDGLISKPDPRLLRQACEAMGVATAETLVIGDSEADVQLARNGAAGCIAIFVPGGFTHGTGAPTADAVIRQFNEIVIGAD